MDDFLKAFSHNFSCNFNNICENWAILKLAPPPQTKRTHSRQFVGAKKLPFPYEESKKKKKGLHKKVSSAVFRAWTDKQKKFYACAKCNLTPQTSFYPFEYPATQESTESIDPTTLQH